MADKSDVVRGLRRYQTKVRSLVDMGLRFEHCTLEDLLQNAFGLQRRYGFLTNDVVSLRLEADCLVSSDNDEAFSVDRLSSATAGARRELYPR